MFLFIIHNVLDLLGEINLNLFPVSSGSNVIDKILKLLVFTTQWLVSPRLTFFQKSLGVLIEDP